MKDLEKAFELPSTFVPGSDDILMAIIGLTVVQTQQTPELLGEILYDLDLARDEKRLNISYLAELQDRFSLALQFNRNRRSLRNIEKITGREMLGLLLSLTASQIEALIAWQDRMIDFVSKNDHDEELRAEMAEFQTWLKNFSTNE